MLLSIAINIYPGTDLYRFALQLETFVWKAEEIKCYELLARELLEKWDRNVFKIPKDNFASAFKRCNFKRLKTTKAISEQIELILACDGNESKASKHINVFKDWCKRNGIENHSVITMEEGGHGPATLRNMAMQVFKGDCLMFRDDDDFSAPIASLLNQVIALQKRGFGDNNPSYLDSIPAYDHISELNDYFLKNQHHPTIAIFEDGIKLKNTWGSIDNPFSKTPTPIDTSKMELVDRPAHMSMCSKIFSREAIKYIHNTSNCNAIEDGRSNYLEQLCQHCVWIFPQERLEWLRKGWDAFKHNEEEGLDVVKWLNVNVISYKHWQIPIGKNHFKEISDLLYDNEDKKYNFRARNIRRLDSFFSHNFIVSKCRPSFVYVLASGSCASDSWTWGSVIGTLEAFRHAKKELTFTIKDLEKLKTILTTSIKTTLINTNNVSTLTWKGPNQLKGEELCQHLSVLTNYKYIFWFAIVHHKSDWKMLAEELSAALSIIREMDTSKLRPQSDCDKLNVQPVHPNSGIKAFVDGEERLLSIDNQKLIEGDLSTNDYVNTNPSPSIQPMIKGGDGKSKPEIRVNLILTILITVVFILIIIFIISFKSNNEEISESSTTEFND